MRSGLPIATNTSTLPVRLSRELHRSCMLRFLGCHEPSPTPKLASRCGPYIAQPRAKRRHVLELTTSTSIAVPNLYYNGPICHGYLQKLLAQWEDVSTLRAAAMLFSRHPALRFPRSDRTAFRYRLNFNPPPPKPCKVFLVSPNTHVRWRKARHYSRRVSRLAVSRRCSRWTVSARI